MQKDNLGKDKLGHLWSVYIDIIPPEEDLHLLFTDVDFYVCSPSCKGINDGTDYIGIAHLTIQEARTNVAKIDDIIIDPPYQNIGIGSLLYKYIETWALKNNISRFYGDLSPDDSDHFNALEHFYKKNGFSFTLFREPTPDAFFLGKIEKHLL